MNYIRLRYRIKFWKKQKLDTLDGDLNTTRGSNQNQYGHIGVSKKSELKRISKGLSDQVDNLLTNDESALYIEEALAGVNSGKTNSNLPI